MPSTRLTCSSGRVASTVPGCTGSAARPWRGGTGGSSRGEEVVAAERRAHPAYDVGVVDVAGHGDHDVGGAVVPR